MTAVYTHGNFAKALEAQRKYMEQLLEDETRIGGHSMRLHRVGFGPGLDGKKITAARKRPCG